MVTVCDDGHNQIDRADLVERRTSRTYGSGIREYEYVSIFQKHIDGCVTSPNGVRLLRSFVYHPRPWLKEKAVQVHIQTSGLVSTLSRVSGRRSVEQRQGGVACDFRGEILFARMIDLPRNVPRMIPRIIPRHSPTKTTNEKGSPNGEPFSIKEPRHISSFFVSSSEPHAMLLHRWVHLFPVFSALVHNGALFADLLCVIL